jgi:lipopolysaccharide export LptBFGC system permease protein LptF
MNNKSGNKLIFTMEKESNIEALFSKTGEYLETRIDLFKLKAVDSSSNAVASLTWRMVVLWISMFSFFFLNLGLSIWIGNVLGQLFYGFFIVGIFYLLTGLIIYLFRHTCIKMPVNDLLVKKLLK